jgi:hypothetical protein
LLRFVAVVLFLFSVITISLVVIVLVLSCLVAIASRIALIVIVSVRNRIIKQFATGKRSSFSLFGKFLINFSRGVFYLSILP